MPSDSCASSLSASWLWRGVCLARARQRPAWRSPTCTAPGALTPAIVLSLGLGVTLLVTLSLIDANVRRTLTSSLPARAPNLFFLDIPAAEADGFHAALGQLAPGAKIERVPMMRGRIVAINGVPAAAIKPPEDAAWVLDGDRGITYAEDLPEGSNLVAGSWWNAEEGVKPLVSFDSELARSLSLSVGGTVTVNVLGRNLTATVANLRKVEWRNLGINFVMVFSPGTFRGAPHSDLATLTLGGGPDAKAEAVILRDIARAFPSVTSVRVKDASRLRSTISSASWCWRSVAPVASPWWRACSFSRVPSRRGTEPGCTTPSC